MERSIIQHQVTAEEAGRSIIEIAETLAGAVGRAAVQRGGAWLDQRRVAEAAQPVVAGMQFTLRLPPGGLYPEVQLDATRIAYEDTWLIVLHKPAGCYVGATPWDNEGNLLSALGRYLAARDGVVPPLHLAHRLDRDTSGLLLVSKDRAANAPLQVAFAEGHVSKRYGCLCFGNPAWEELELASGHGRSAGGRWRIYPYEEIGMRLPAGGGRVKLARTRLRVAQQLAGAALVQAWPATGRTHQIRLHMAAAGHPLLGDQRYGGPASYAEITLAGHLLHASELRLRHPLTGADLELHSPLPPHFNEILEAAHLESDPLT